jgi:hypothetical protein
VLEELFLFGLQLQQRRGDKGRDWVLAMDLLDSSGSKRPPISINELTITMPEDH